MDPIAWKCVNKGKIGELCSEDDDCETNRCETFLTGNQCQEVGQEGDTCSNNNDCGFGLDCRGLAPPWRCQKAISDNGISCNSDNDCESGRCEMDGLGWKCVDIGKLGDSCSVDNDCQSGRCESNPILFQCVSKGKLGDSCSVDNDCEEGLDCRGFTDWKCEIAKSPIGTSCSSDTDCESGRCEMDGLGWKCVDIGKLGDSCSVDNDCESGRCESNPILFQCVNIGKLGDSCSEDDDCENDLECRGITSWKCELPKAPNGARCTFDSDCASNRCECGWGCACTSRGKKGDSCSNDGDCEPGLECKGWFDWDCE